MTAPTLREAKASGIAAMARREASVASASSVSGDDAGAEHHHVRPLVVSGPKNAPDGDRGGGGIAQWHWYFGTFGVYNGNWGGRRKYEWPL